MKNQIGIWLIAFLAAACYEDKGNYTYHDINQLTVNNVDTTYHRDQFDTLRIFPELIGTMYNDEERFSYEWVVSDKVVATTKNLTFSVELPLGKNECKLIITDKELGTKNFQLFSIYVTSAFASDGIVVLSNYKGKAELSYKRLDKEVPFQGVYYEKVFGYALGTEPRKIGQNFYPYSRIGGLMVLSKEGLQVIDPTVMESTGKYIDVSYVNTTAIPKPNLSSYEVIGFEHWLGRYMEFFGNMWIDDYSFVVTEEGLTIFQIMNLVGQMNYSCKVVYSPYGGKLSPVVYPFVRVAGAGRGYDMAEQYVIFDETAGRFAYCDAVMTRETYPFENLKVFPGYQMIFGRPVKEQNYSLAILSNGETTKLLYLNIQEKMCTIEGEVDVPGKLMDRESDYLMMLNSPHLFWKKGNKLYRYNITNIYSGGIAPTESDQIISLDQLNLGYDANAEITCMYLTRSEKSIVMGVSRYGSDITGESDELKGDVIILDTETWKVKDYYPGVSGYPVDILVKYQEHFRGGMDESGKMIDNI